MLCVREVKTKDGFKPCGKSVWTNAAPLCKDHFKYEFPISHARLEKEIPCVRCYQAGMFRFEDGSRDIIIHKFTKEEFDSLTPKQREAVTAYCPDCYGRFWVKRQEVAI